MAKSSGSSLTYLGNTAAYCGSGCQPAFGSCGYSHPAASHSSLPLATTTQGYFPPSSTGRSPLPSRSGCLWMVDGVGSFTHSQVFDFAQLSSIPAFLEVSSYIVGAGNAPHAHEFSQNNVALKDGYLQLKVPGGQYSSPIQGAEVSTSDKSIHLGSIRTLMQISTIPGTCHGTLANLHMWIRR